MADRRLPARASSGFTLLEALVALIMFGFIMLALSLALAAALRAQNASETVQDENGQMRGVFDSLTRDIQAAYASPNNPVSQFIAGGSSSSSQNANAISGSLLALTTLSHRIVSDDPTQMGLSANAAQSQTAQPQSDILFIRYDLDPSSGTLTRTVSTVPYAQNLSQPGSTPDVVLAQHVVSLTLQFWDSRQQTWRQDWDFEQPNYVPGGASATTSAGTTSAGTTGAAGGTSGAAAATTPTGDQLLPTAVQVSIVMTRRDGSPATYTTTIPVIAPQPLDTTNPVITPTSSGTSSAGK